MRKNLPDRKLSMKEKLDLEKHHYEIPDHVCKCGCGYNADSCVKDAQDRWNAKQKELKQKELQNKQEKNNEIR